MSAGTRSSAITAQAPASSATLAWSAVTTSMITPPFNISARPLFTRIVPVCIGSMLFVVFRELVVVVRVEVVAAELVRVLLGLVVLVLPLRLFLFVERHDVRLLCSQVFALTVVEVHDDARN